MNNCTVLNCDRPKFGHGLCSAHYGRWRRTGDTRPDDPIMPVQKGITQQDTYDAFERLTLEKGWPPTVRELGEALGLESTSSTKHHLDSLVRDGWIVREPGRPRAIRLIGKPSGVPVRDAYGEVGAGAGTPEEKGSK